MNIPDPLPVRVQPDPKSEERHREEKENRETHLRIARRLNWITGIAGAAAVFYAAITYFQWRDLRHEFAVQQRAWIKATVGPIDMIPGIRVVSHIDLVNVGKSVVPAYHAESVIEIVKSEERPTFFGPVLHRSRQGVSLYPDEKRVFDAFLMDGTTNSPRAFTQPEIDDFNAGRTYIVAYGFVRYEDQFGKHWMSFCTWQLGAEVEIQAGPCTEFNRVGDGDMPDPRKT